MEYEKWKYIRLISNLSPIHNYHLVNMMDKYNCDNLQQITYEQAKEYYEMLFELDTKRKKDYFNMYR